MRDVDHDQDDSMICARFQSFKKSQKELEKVDFKSRMGERSAHRGKN
jgi:hypothetical protein